MLQNASKVAALMNHASNIEQIKDHSEVPNEVLFSTTNSKTQGIVCQLKVDSTRAGSALRARGPGSSTHY